MAALPGLRGDDLPQRGRHAWAASAPSAITTGTSRPTSGSAKCSTRGPSRNGTAISSRPTRWASPTRSPTPSGSRTSRSRTGLREAALCGAGMIRARRVAFGVTDSAFIMGSMGSVVGEKLTRTVERATEQNLPLIIVSGSGGGARMHEGILSLMQMAKVSRRAGPLRPGRRPVHLGAHQSHDGRRRGQLRLAGRRGASPSRRP